MEGFEYDARQDLWLSEESTGLDWADGSEDYLRRVFEQATTITDYPVEFARFIKDWPSRYHLSHLRVNALEAIRRLLDPSWKALELGGGTGVITKWLAQAVAEVDVLEGSPERARVNRIRTREAGNVRVLVGDMVSVPFPAEYDLVTLVGVLEYTPSRPSVTRRQACLELLKKIRTSLRDEGVLLVAIENRLGAKYWTGCGEDHTTRLFDGLLGYPDDTPLTFSRNELEALLREAGFDHQQFYHLHPDYKLPTTVIREANIPSEVALHQWTQGFAEDYMNLREYLLPDPLLVKSVEDAGLFWQFSNSFLVLCSPSQDTRLAEKWLAKKYSNSSRPELHHTITLVERGGNLVIERAPLRQGLTAVDFGEYRFRLSDSEYVPGSLLAIEAYAALMSQDWFQRLTTLCRELLDAALCRFGLTSKDPQDHFDMIDGAALDFTLWNIIRTKDASLEFFDTKWSSGRPVPADYILFRSLFYLLSSASPFVQLDIREALVKMIRQFYEGFDDARLAEHLETETSLQECVHAGDLSGLSLDAEGHLTTPATGWSTLSQLRWIPALQQQLRAVDARLQGWPERVARVRDKKAAASARVRRSRASASARARSSARSGVRRVTSLAQRALHSRARRLAARTAWILVPALMKRRARNSQPPLAPRNPRKRRVDHLLLAEEARGLDYHPLISVLVPVYNTSPDYLHRAVDTVLTQAYAEWELVICDDGSTRSETRAALARIGQLDARIQVLHLKTNSGISAATNAALAKARGEFVAMLDHDDELLPETLLEVARALNVNRELDVVYTDQDYIDAEGEPSRTFYKPDWSLEMFRGVMYVGHLLVVRRALADAVGGFDPAFDNVQDFEFMLRVAEKTERILHLPKILYHWRMIPGSVAFGGNEKQNIEPLQAAAVNAHLSRCGVEASARPNPRHAHRLLIEPGPRLQYPSVSIMLCAAGAEKHVQACCESVLANSDYPDREVIVTGGSLSDQTARRLEALGAFIEAPGQDARAAVRAAVERAGGDLLVFMQGDLEVQTPDWLEHLIFDCSLPGVGCVSPVILAHHGAVSSAGLILGGPEMFIPAMRGLDPQDDGHAGSLSCVREVSAIPGDCYAVLRTTFGSLGGLNRLYAAEHSQATDLSLRARSAGLRNLCTPRVLVRHLGPPPGDKHRDALDDLLLIDTWEPLTLKGDPFHNPNFIQAVPGYQE